MKLFCLKLLLILATALHLSGQEINYYPSTLESGAVDFIGPNALGQFTLATTETADSSVSLGAQFEHRRWNSNLYLVDSVGNVAVTQKFNAGFSNMPDTNFYITDIAPFDDDIWVLLRSDYYENDTIQWEKTEVLQYSADLLELKRRIPLEDSLDFAGFSFFVDKQAVTVIGQSRRNHPFSGNPIYVTCKRYFPATDSLETTSVEQRDLTMEIFPFSDIIYNPVREEYFWVIGGFGFVDIITFSDALGLQSQNIIPDNFTNIVTKDLGDRFLVAGNYKDPFVRFEGLLFQELNYNYQIGYNQLLEEEKEDYTIQLCDIQVLPTGDLTVAVNDYPPFESGLPVSGRILHIGPPGSYAVVKEVPFTLDKSLFITSHRNLKNDELAIYGSTNHPKSDSALAVLILSDEQGVTNVTELLPKTSGMNLIINNPSKEFLRLSPELTNYPLEVSIHNTLGQPVFSIQLKNTSNINTAHFEPGVYLLNITDNSGATLTQKFIKE